MKKTNIILIIILFFLLILFIFLASIAFKKILIYSVEKSFYTSNLEFIQANSESVFSIDKITYFSSATADSTTNSNSNYIISNLTQYTDIAIFINNNSDDELTMKNTLKSVTLDNISYSNSPIIGTPNLYYKNLNNFAKPDFSTNIQISDSITFETTSENTLDYSKPILYNNCANPITLSYTNSNLKNEFALSSNSSEVSFNGTLLNYANIVIKSIDCTIDFDIKITNNLNEIYICPISLNIPLQTDNSSIYDGTLILKDLTSYRFIKEQNN